MSNPTNLSTQRKLRDLLSKKKSQDTFQFLKACRSGRSALAEYLKKELRQLRIDPSELNNVNISEYIPRQPDDIGDIVLNIGLFT